jgi:hypothetical protein
MTPVLRLPFTSFRRWDFGSTGFTGCGKSLLARHSERSEESLFGLNPREEGFLGTQRASE